MILGNSGGNNKGKKYFTRNSIENTKLSDNDFIKVEKFNTWYIENYNSLKSFLNSKSTLDEDVMIDTYIRICESLLYTDIEIACFKSYFCRSYYTNYILSRTKNNRYCPIEDHIFSLSIDESEEYIEKLKAEDNLYNDILYYAKYNLPEEYYHLFKLNMTDERFSIIDASKYLGLPAHQSQRILVQIKENISRMFARQKQAIKEQSL